MGSTKGNLSKGITASFTKNSPSGRVHEKFCSESFFPIIAFEATLTNDFPIALEMKGTVLDALGLTSII